MFKNYKDICDVVTLVIFCPADKSVLLCKEINGEYWMPSFKSEKSCWKITAQKAKSDILGQDSPNCTPIRIYKIWLPNHCQTYVYHAVFKVCLKSDMKKKFKRNRPRLQWVNNVELERLRVHWNLRSPEVAVFTQLAFDETPSDLENPMDVTNGFLTEVCEYQALPEEGAGELSPIHCNLLLAAKYTRDDQRRLYREFLLLSYPAMYISPLYFSQFMVDLGWQKEQCVNLFRAADVTSRGGISFQDLLLWAAAIEPGTEHSGTAAEIRCKYIFRYFDTNDDSRLEYVEFKELIGAARNMRQLPADALSVSRDVDLCIRQLGLPQNSGLSLVEFLRAVGELRVRGTSSLLRSPRSISAYLADLVDRDFICPTPDQSGHSQLESVGMQNQKSNERNAHMTRVDYTVAAHTIKLNKKAELDLIELKELAEEAVSVSAVRMAGVGSLEVLSQVATPTEAIAAVHYFACAYDKIPLARRRANSSAGATSVSGKNAMSWYCSPEELHLGTQLLRLAEAVRPICASEPRLLRLAAPVYAIGDLHGNLGALLAMEKCLWPAGPALTPASILFLGDYVDRGPHGTELLAYLLSAKLQRPKGVILVRGNHESRDIQKMFTFHGECIQKYGEVDGMKIWNAINLVFDVMPLAAVVDEKVFCCHGGIPPPWVCPLVSAIDKVPVPLPRPAEQSSLAWELMWNDPIKVNKMTASLALELAANEGFAANSRRGTGHVFDQGALDRFLHVNQLSHVVRAHEVHQSGFMCQMRGRLVSVFSSSHYCGANNDSGVVMLEGEKLRLIRICADTN